MFCQEKPKIQDDRLLYQSKKKLDILMRDGKPIGGKWTFDGENRKKIPQNTTPPPFYNLKRQIIQKMYLT